MGVADQSIGAFLDGVASKNLTPSGGAVAAVAGAAGAALCEMVRVHTDGSGAGEALATDRKRLLELADADVRAVERMQAAFETHGGDAPETQAALKAATEGPLETAGACLDVLERAHDVMAEGVDHAAADAITGAFLAHAALRSALAAARANLELVAEESFVAGAQSRVAELEAAGDRALGRAVGAGPDWAGG